MKDYFLIVLFSLPFIVPVYIHLRRGWKMQEYLKRLEIEEAAEEMGGRVFEILRLVYLDLNKQHAAAYGPWISSALEHRCGDPAIALTAVRFVLRDLQNLPVGDGVEYVKGVEYRFNLDGLRSAEAELMKMTGEGA